MPRVLLRAVAAGLLLVSVANTAPASETTETSEQRRQRIAGMSAVEKHALQEKQARFSQLSHDERERLRALHEQLSTAPDAGRLCGVLARYSQWLKTLPAGQRADLLSLPPQERMAEIKRLMHEQETRDMRSFVARELSDEDLKAIMQWVDGIIMEREEEILAEIPMLRERLANIDDPHRRKGMLYMAIRMGPRRDVLRPDNEDVDRLVGQLSPAARKELEQAREEDRLPELADRWMRAALYSRRGLVKIDEEELRRFYKESLDARQRDYLESLPPDRMHFELQRLYNASRFEQFFQQGPAGFKRPSGGRRGAGRFRPREAPGGGRPGDAEGPAVKRPLDTP